ncbi:MAG: trypsin-like serine protease [Polyangia bacterium]
MRIRTSLMVAFASSLCACGAATPTDDSTQEIVGGAVDSGDAAVGIVWVTSSGESCTGTRIAPNVVITAAHCLLDPGATVPHTDVTFYTGNGSAQPWNGGHLHAPFGMKAFTVKSVVADPGYVPGCPSVGDVALLYLANNWKPQGYAAYATSAGDEPTVGQSVTTVGFGLHEDNTAGIKRSATGVVSAWPTVPDRSADLLFVERDVTATGGLASRGDSGGPLFYNGKLAGTVKCQTTTDDLNHDEYYERLDSSYVAGFVTSQVATFEAACRNDCAAFYTDCGTDCLCLAQYYQCLRGCGVNKPVISCFGGL